MKYQTIAAALLATASATFNTSHPSNSTDCSKCKPFTIDVTWGATDASSMLSRGAILTNGSLPGPRLDLKVGDCVDFTVINNMPNVTGVHFHGIRQLNTPWSDGVPGLSQYGIKSGDSYTYTWTADEPGTYFYHSHYKGQMMDGLYGAIVIAPASDTTTPFSQIDTDVTGIEKALSKLETVFASDWNQFTFNEFFEIEKAANIDDACMDQVILNGQGSTYCLSASELAANSRPQVPLILGNETLTAKGCIPADNVAVQGAYNRDLSKLPPGAYDVCTPSTGKNYTYSVDASDKWAAMSFISPSGFAIFVVTIDSHKLYVYEINGHYITPQVVDQISLSPGDRISFLVKLDQTPADYAIRVANGGLNQVISGFGSLSYKGAKGSAGVAAMNYGGVSPANSTITLLNAAAAAPFPAVAVNPSADKTFVLDVMKDPQESESWAWVLNGLEPYSQDNDDDTPLLYAGPSNIPESDLILRTNYNEWVDLIIKVAGPLAEPHPIHKHANKFFVIGEGTGDFNYSTVAQAQSAGVSFNLVNPPYVDGYTSTPSEGVGAWMVFRYQANTPGAWFLHCHIQTHFSGGMGVAILDAVDKFPTVPGYAGQSCAARGSGNGTTGGHGSGSGSTTTSGHGHGSTTTPSGSDSTSTNGWGDWASAAPTASVKGDGKTHTPVGPANSPSAYADQWSVWKSISSAAAAATHGGHTVTAGSGKGKGSDATATASGTWSAWSAAPTSADPTSTGTWADWSAAASSADPTSTATWSAWASASTPVDAAKTSSVTWAAWSSSGAPVDATTVAASSTWAAWSSAGTPVDATTAAASSTWSAWTTSVTPAAASASAHGVSGYNGTSPAGIATYTGAAVEVKVGGSMVFVSIMVGALALLV